MKDYKYAVVCYQPIDEGEITEANPRIQVIYHAGNIETLVEEVKDYIKTFELQEDDWRCGQVFSVDDYNTIIGTITYNGEYIHTKAV